MWSWVDDGWDTAQDPRPRGPTPPSVEARERACPCARVHKRPRAHVPTAHTSACAGLPPGVLSSGPVLVIGVKVELAVVEEEVVDDDDGEEDGQHAGPGRPVLGAAQEAEVEEQEEEEDLAPQVDLQHGEVQ